MSDAPRSAPARRGRPPQIRAEDILAAVEGRLGDEWTVASVAAELGVTDAAIYRYFPSRKAILEAIADRVFAQVPVPSYNGDVRALLGDLGRTWYEMFVQNPSFLDLDKWVGIASAGGLDGTEQILNEFLRAGFDVTDAPAVLGTVTAVCREYARITVVASRATVTAVSWDADTHPTLNRAIVSCPSITLSEAFEQAMDIVVDGALQQLPRHRRSASGKRASSPRRP